MRILTNEELKLIAGGVTGSSDIVITGVIPDDDDGDNHGPPDGGGNGDDGGGTGGGGGEHDPSPPDELDCWNSQPVELLDGTSPPDNAEYYLPEGVSQAYLNSAVAHIQGILNNNILNKPAVYVELYSMYTDNTNPYYVDFKDWGTSAGPAGTISAGNIEYYSDAKGQVITPNAFEPFGNYFFGLICTLAGLSDDEVYAVAAATQTGSHVFDDVTDSPHVKAGIEAAEKVLADPSSPYVVRLGADCSS